MNRWKCLTTVLSTFAFIYSVGSPAGSASAVADEAAGEPSLTIGSKAPSIDVEHWVSDGNGKFKPVTAFTSDHVYVVEFWATWCGPCIASMPHLADIQNTYLSKNVQIISISDEDLETVEAFLKRPVRGSAGRPTAGKDDAEAPQTYGQLTSAYCLTTDPDGSVQADYMRAAGQNGIPTCFIVGKTGLIEWIGHPMSMDEPLSQIVAGKWDRESFSQQFRKEQERSLMMAKLSRIMRQGDTKGAIALLDSAIESAEGDAETVSYYEQLKFRVKVTVAAQKIQADEFEEGLKELNELLRDADEMQVSQLHSMKVNLLLSKQRYDDVVASLSELTAAKDFNPALINEVTWGLYQFASRNRNAPESVVAAATKAATAAVNKEPENGMIIDTLAHLVHLQGDLDRAIELQEKAIRYAGDAPVNVLNEMKNFLSQLKDEKAEKK